MTSRYAVEPTDAKVVTYQPRLPKTSGNTQLQSFLDTCEQAEMSGAGVLIPVDQLRDLMEAIDPRSRLGSTR